MNFSAAANTLPNIHFDPVVIAIPHVEWTYDKFMHRKCVCVKEDFLSWQINELQICITSCEQICKDIATTVNLTDAIELYFLYFQSHLIEEKKIK